jgi:hypothetical protein
MRSPPGELAGISLQPVRPGLASFAGNRPRPGLASFATGLDAEGFTVVERRGPKMATLAEHLAAARPKTSQRTRRALHGFRNPPLGTVAAWHPSLDGGRAVLGSLQRDEGLLAAISRPGLVEAVVDSGAEESVAPPGCFAAKVMPSPMSRAGGRYRAANGSRIKNVGQQKVAFTTAEGHQCAMPFQVAEVERPLISVAQLTSAGNRVVLGDTGGQMVHIASGKTIELVRRGGVYLLLMDMGVGIGVASGFPRQGK